MSELWKQSKCFGGWLHDFEIKKQKEECVREVCSRCHKTVFFKIRGGRVNNYNYLNHHLRSALQKYHPRFNKEYAR